MKLHRWHRIGIVISVLWVVLAVFYERGKQVDAATSHAVAMGKLCLDANQKPFAACLDDQNQLLKEALKPNWANVVVFAFSPVVIGWLVMLLGRKIYGWVRAGEP